MCHLRARRRCDPFASSRGQEGTRGRRPRRVRDRRARRERRGAGGAIKWGRRREEVKQRITRMGSETDRQGFSEESRRSLSPMTPSPLHSAGGKCVLLKAYRNPSEEDVVGRVRIAHVLTRGDKLKVGMYGKAEASGGYRQIREDQLPQGRAHWRPICVDREGKRDGGFCRGGHPTAVDSRPSIGSHARRGGGRRRRELMDFVTVEAVVAACLVPLYSSCCRSCCRSCCAPAACPPPCHSVQDLHRSTMRTPRQDERWRRLRSRWS